MKAGTRQTTGSILKDYLADTPGNFVKGEFKPAVSVLGRPTYPVTIDAAIIRGLAVHKAIGRMGEGFVSGYGVSDVKSGKLLAEFSSIKKAKLAATSLSNVIDFSKVNADKFLITATGSNNATILRNIIQYYQSVYK